MKTQIKNHVRILIVVAIAALIVNVTLADDLNPPAYRGDPLSVYAHWQDPLDGTLDLHLTGFAAVDDVGDPTTTLDPLPVSAVVNGPDYQFDLPNWIDKMPRKLVAHCRGKSTTTAKRLKKSCTLAAENARRNSRPCDR